MTLTRPTLSALGLVIATTFTTGCEVKKEESGTNEFDINLAATGMFLIGSLADVGTMASTTFPEKAATAISQRQARVTVTGECEVNQGKITLDVTDTDNNRVLSIGDTIKATFDQCAIKDSGGIETLNGEINLTATGVDSTTHEATALDIHVNLTNLGLGLTADMTYQSLPQKAFRIEMVPGSAAQVAVGSRVIPVSAFTAAYGAPALSGFKVQMNLTAADPVYGTLEVALDSLVALNGSTTQTDVTASGSTVRITSAGNGNLTLRGTSGEQTVKGQVLIDAVKNR